MKLKLAALLIITGLLASCKKTEKTPTFTNEGHELVYNMVEKVGNYATLAKKHDVSYTYTYEIPDGKKDVALEKYIFDGEYSYGKYLTHERTLPDLEGTLEQGYDGKDFWFKQNGVASTDPKILKRVAFNRPTNFYWFTMMQKLLDPGLNYEYLGEKQVDNKNYDLVKVSFAESAKPTDIYQLYINKETGLVDQFLFTVADFGAMKPKLMQVEYEDIDGLLIPTKRRYKNSTWNADVDEKPWIQVNWTDIKFNTGLTVDEFKK